MSAGIVDVPGHERFIKNMLAGAGGMAMVLLVVAADEGFMPQTREYLSILSLLNVKTGLIVVTKCDTVDDEWLEMVEEDIRNEVQGTFLQDAPILPVSSYTGQGLEALREHIAQVARTATEKDRRAPLRIPVDRVFTMEGFGTVITGTLIEGTLNKGEEVRIYPADRPARVRNVQVHNADVQQAVAGQRVAVNLSGLKKDEVARGDTVAAPGALEPTMMLDVRLNVIKECARTIENGQRLHLYVGTRSVLCKLILLDAEMLTAGESGFAQLRLTEPVAVKEGDFYVVRFYSPLERCV